jgi:hypothetical protein
MIKSSYTFPDGSMFGRTYEYAPLDEPCEHTWWLDPVGKKFSHAANKYARAFNSPHAKIWDVMDDLLNVSEKDEAIQYESQEDELRNMWL